MDTLRSKVILQGLIVLDQIAFSLSLWLMFCMMPLHLDNEPTPLDVLSNALPNLLDSIFTKSQLLVFILPMAYHAHLKMFF